MNLSDLDVRRALVVGDTHGNLFEWQRRIIPTFYKTNADVIVQIGDFGFGWNPEYLSTLDELLDEDGELEPIPMFWLDGNHENFDLMEHVGVFPDKTEPQSTSRNTTYLPRGYRWNWKGVECMALGGAYSVDKFYRTPHRSWWPQEEITNADLERALQEHDPQWVDVLFAHDCYEGVRVPGVHADWKQDEFAEVCRPNREKLLKVVRKLEVQMFVHGHFHKNYASRGHFVHGRRKHPTDQDLHPQTIIGVNCDSAAGNCITLDFPTLAWEWAT